MSGASRCYEYLAAESSKSAGPHAENALLPNRVLVRWMTAALVDVDHSLDRWQCSEAVYVCSLLPE